MVPRLDIARRRAAQAADADSASDPAGTVLDRSRRGAEWYSARKAVGSGDDVVHAACVLAVSGAPVAAAEGCGRRACGGGQRVAEHDAAAADDRPRRQG